MTKKLILDLDGTLFRFHDEVDYIERMYEENFFRNLKPFENMIAGVKEFMIAHPEVEVYTCSSVIDSPYCIPEKNEALDEYLPEIDQAHRIFPKMGESKAQYIPGGVDHDTYLVDDYNIGLNKFLAEGGNAIKVHNNVNMRGTGAYGGDTDFRWAGEIVHTEDNPSIIAAELSSIMELSYQLGTLCQKTNISLINSFQDLRAHGLYIHPLNKDIGMTGYHKDGYEAHKMINSYQGHVFYFKNPIHAIRWLNGDELSKEYYISDKISLSRMQLESVFFNMGVDSTQYLAQKEGQVERPMPDQLRKQIVKSYEESKKPLYGIIKKEGKVTHYHSFEAMEKASNQYAGMESVEVQWLLEPRTLKPSLDCIINSHSQPEKNPTSHDDKNIFAR